MSKAGAATSAGKATADLWLLPSYLVIAIFSSAFINVNTFSMHGLYRNRLMRAYLGASNEERNPDPYTKFDSSGNMDVSDAPSGPSAPTLVINLTLNLVAGRNLAWQERKAEPMDEPRQILVRN